MSNVTDIISSLQNILFMQNEVVTTQDIKTQDRTPRDKNDPVDVPFVPDDAVSYTHLRAHET